MINFIEYIKDTLGNNYLGVKISPQIVEPFLNELKDLIGEEDFNTYTDLQKKRDHGSYHLTVINVMEYNKLMSEKGMDNFVNSLDDVLKYEIDDLKLKGIGSATKNENRSYFIVCESDKLDTIRDRYELNKFDFHITLGFKWKDVHGVRKNVIVEKKNKFLKLLKAEYYKRENWNFIRNIGNFDLNPESEIIPVSLTDDKLKIKCDGHYLDVSILDDERFWIFTRYPIEQDLPRLPTTEFSKILNKV